MPSTLRTIAAAAAVLSFGAFAAGCGGGASGADSRQDLDLQPIAAPGPDPFTRSTAESAATPAPATPSAPGGTAQPSAVPAARPVSGSTPGLYGGTQSVASCDVEKQIRFLSGDRAKNRAFAGAAGVDPGSVPSFLRGLTPVVLRVDTRVTNHGFRAGAATGFQSVLQAGTAVLVDDHGAPRVRCACGNPLKPPGAHQGGWNAKGKPWPGYRADRVVVVRPTTVVIDNLIIVNVVNNTWIERPTGDDGRHDRRRPDIHIDPEPPVPAPVSPPASPSTSPPATSPAPSPDCPSPAPTVTVTPSAPSAPSTPSAPASEPAPSPSGCPRATVTAPPLSPPPSSPSSPPVPEPSSSGDMPAPPTDVPSGVPSSPDYDIYGPSPETENV
ncbi:DUF6777 domain-containing protein [Streptomyces sp. NPDC006711]|uniref:DUF6777 domain-containing protein n=1 Tax=Streptomyces sp. NPDC006711 TaxID=3364762 RepID=UPI003689024C